MGPRSLTRNFERRSTIRETDGWLLLSKQIRKDGDQFRWDAVQEIRRGAHLRREERSSGGDAEKMAPEASRFRKARRRRVARWNGVSSKPATGKPVAIYGGCHRRRGASRFVPCGRVLAQLTAVAWRSLEWWRIAFDQTNWFVRINSVSGAA